MSIKQAWREKTTMTIKQAWKRYYNVKAVSTDGDAKQCPVQNNDAVQVLRRSA